MATTNSVMLCACFALLLVINGVYADVYMHNPRGSNNRYGWSAGESDVMGSQRVASRQPTPIFHNNPTGRHFIILSVDDANNAPANR